MNIKVITGVGNSRTFLRSTSHIRVKEKSDKLVRSTLVGIQFAIVHLPNEVLQLILLPLFRDLISAGYSLGSNVIFVGSSAVSALYSGLNGRLEATEGIEITLIKTKAKSASA